MTRKYLKGGALNPAWCEEQDAAMQAEWICECLEDLFKTGMEMDLNLQLSDAVNVNLSNRSYEEMFSSMEAESIYEAKFNFIKNHSDTPEDLKLAREILGLK